MPQFNDITGVILAGGRSSRFGSNKAFATYEGISLIDRVLNVMSPLFQELILVTNTPDEYQKLGLPIFTDFEPYQGPLGAIFTALRSTRNDSVFVVGCDMPLIDPAVIEKIIVADPEADVTVPIQDGIPQYLMAIYSRRILFQICRFLGEGRDSLKEFCTQIANICWVPIDGISGLSINTPEDLRRMEEENAS